MKGHFIIRIPVPEAPGLVGVGSHIPGSDKPRSDSGMRLTLPSTTPEVPEVRDV